MSARIPARLHVLLARDARTGVIIRRGPARAVCTIGWDRARDTFTTGQWLRGRIYERRSDLSPDGRHLIYFAMNGRWESRAKGAWTAISRTPYLKAVALHAKGDCWNGGGLFVDNRRYWLNGPHEPLADAGETTALIGADAPYRATWGGECLGVYFNRLARDGWTMREDLASGARLSRVHVWEKPLFQGWVLRKLAHATVGPPIGRSVYYDEHELVHPDRKLPRHDWEWADLDGKRLVWASRGRLHAGRITAKSARADDPVEAVALLADFDAMTFEARPAPY